MLASSPCPDSSRHVGSICHSSAPGATSARRHEGWAEPCGYTPSRSPSWPRKTGGASFESLSSQRNVARSTPGGKAFTVPGAQRVAVREGPRRGKLRAPSDKLRPAQAHAVHVIRKFVGDGIGAALQRRGKLADQGLPSAPRIHSREPTLGQCFFRLDEGGLVAVAGLAQGRDPVLQRRGQLGKSCPGRPPQATACRQGCWRAQSGDARPRIHCRCRCRARSAQVATRAAGAAPRGRHGQGRPADRGCPQAVAERLPPSRPAAALYGDAAAGGARPGPTGQAETAHPAQHRPCARGRARLAARADRSERSAAPSAPSAPCGRRRGRTCQRHRAPSAHHPRWERYPARLRDTGQHPRGRLSG